MQLILSTDTEIGIYKKMATVKQEHTHEKDAAVSLVEEIINNITNENKENVDKRDLIVECTEKVNNEKSFDGKAIKDIVNSKDELIHETDHPVEESSQSSIVCNNIDDCRTEVSVSGNLIQENGIGNKNDTTGSLNALVIESAEQQQIKDNDDNDIKATVETTESPSNNAIPSEIVTVEEAVNACRDEKEAITKNKEVINVADKKYDHDVKESLPSKDVIPSETITEAEVDKACCDSSENENLIDIADERSEQNKESLPLNNVIPTEIVAIKEDDNTCSDSNEPVTDNDIIDIADDDHDVKKSLSLNDTLLTENVTVEKVKNACYDNNETSIKNEDVVNIADAKSVYDVKESLPVNDAILTKIDTVAKTDNACCDSNEAITKNDEVIDIAEENSDNNGEESLLKNLTYMINNCDSKNLAIENNETKSFDNKNDDTKSKYVDSTNIVTSIESSIIEIDAIEEIAKTDKDTNKNKNEINKGNIDKSIVEGTDHTKNEPQIQTKSKEKIKLSHISNLSNTLDILSDEEDDTSIQQEFLKEVPADNKQCINIEDDDDIMLIDDETVSKDNTSTTTDVLQPELENNSSEATTLDRKVECDNGSEPVEKTNNQLVAILPETKVPEANVNIEDNKKIDETVQLPLLPSTFLETCKKNLANMTHEELEEFCIIKLVESVIDRSNLGEIRTQLKSMVQKIEGYEKKVFLLTKQNRDLQLVLKSVQEEQKKNNNSSVITPLKITRSVGMQVLMTDKNSRKRSVNIPIGVNSMSNNQNTTNASNRQNKPQPQTNQIPRNSKIPPNTQQIPVPRLVPAGNAGNTKNNVVNPASKTNTTMKSQAMNNTAISAKTTAPAQKSEKRPHFHLIPPVPSTETVDLTDEEPPAKLTRNNNAPVRCVPPQNLLAPRPSVVQNMNSPRKVYIPIGGPQSQNAQIHKERTGQTVMFRSMSPQTSRPRVPSPNVKMVPSPNTLRMGRVAFKHPAPLPDSMKQYQPPNWKGLPPSPELKLSKVENGIVISWKIDGYQEDCHEEIASYQLFAYQETSSPPSTSLWKKIGDVKALPLPMACTLTQFMAGFKYYFAVRAVDVKSRFGPFSKPGSILLFSTV